MLSALARRSKALWGYDHAFMEACRDELTLEAPDIDAGRVFVLESAGQPIGFYLVEPLHGARMELGMLFVEPSVIRRGAGRVLLEHAKDAARAAGAAWLVIQSDPHVVGFYEKLGATVVGAQPSASIEGRTLPLLELPLA